MNFKNILDGFIKENQIQFCVRIRIMIFLDLSQNRNNFFQVRQFLILFGIKF